MTLINFFLARSENKIFKATELVSKEYLKEGYFKDNTKTSLFDYNFLSSSFVFTAEKNNIFVGTVALIGDGEKGLPMENIYSKEIQGLRSRGKQVAEISQLAIDRDIVDKNDRIFKSNLIVNLFSLIFNKAKEIGTDVLCIAINPKHDSFYKMLGFSELGSLKYYSNVNNAPALARYFDLKSYDLDSNKNIFLKKITEIPIDVKKLSSDNDIKVFSLKC